MKRELAPHKDKIVILYSIIIGGIFGVIIGMPISIWINFGSINFSSLAAFLSQITVDQIITRSILWIIAGGILGALLAIYNSHEKVEYDQEIKQYNTVVHPNNNTEDKLIIPLREEHLNIYKDWIKTAEVSVSKETITEEKKITVPVLHEYLIISKKSLASNAGEEEDISNDTIRIPISEEQIDISKHKVILEDVKISKHQFEDIKHIEVTLKKEKLHMDTTGDAIISNENDKNNYENKAKTP
jgi:uncharacterized protein (TIGR02271 family)